MHEMDSMTDLCIFEILGNIVRDKDHFALAADDKQESVQGFQ